MLVPPARTSGSFKWTAMRSTPHLIEARDRIIKDGNSAASGSSSHAVPRPSAGSDPARLSSTTRCGPAGPHALARPAGPSADVALLHGVQRNCHVHMFDTTRDMLGLGWPTRVASTGGDPLDKRHSYHCRHANRHLSMRPKHRLAAPHLGQHADPNIPGTATFAWRQGTLKASVFGHDFIPSGDQDKATPPRRHVR